MDKQQKDNAKLLKRVFPSVNIDALSKSIQQIFTATSEKPLGDCYEIHSHAIEFLQNKGVDAKMIMGNAAWRVDGKDGGAVLSHFPQENGTNSHHIEGYKPLWFHCWIQLNNHWFIDLTSYQFKEKMKVLDAHDGGNTSVTWAPPYLSFHRSQLSSYETVREAYKSGVFFYKEDKAVADILNQNAAKHGEKQNIQSELNYVYEMAVAGHAVDVIGPNSKAG